MKKKTYWNFSTFDANFWTFIHFTSLWLTIILKLINYFRLFQIHEDESEKYEQQQKIMWGTQFLHTQHTYTSNERRIDQLMLLLMLMMMKIMCVAVTNVWTSDVIIVHSFGQFKKKKTKQITRKILISGKARTAHIPWLWRSIHASKDRCESRKRERENNRKPYEKCNHASHTTPPVCSIRLFIYFQRQVGILDRLIGIANL